MAVKDFLEFAEGLTKRLCRGMDQLVQDAGRKARYLPGVVDKEELVQEIRGKEGVAENGLVRIGPPTASPGRRASHPEARVVARSRPDQEDPAYAPLCPDGIRGQGHLCDLGRTPSLPVAVGSGLKCAHNNNASAVNGVSRATPELLARGDGRSRSVLGAAVAVGKPSKTVSQRPTSATFALLSPPTP